LYPASRVIAIGLEGQRAAVDAYAGQTGARIKSSYVEVESGKRIDRPALTKALAHARRSRSTLVVQNSTAWLGMWNSWPRL
jgi:DNA invertase Pin-like site-specific DNA recombinase